uniref:Uncharacterized protein n=1 Tax=Steinernema glaseri TaxID=37863 RepID=A0A1I7ZWJ3_9BILA
MTKRLIECFQDKMTVDNIAADLSKQAIVIRAAESCFLTATNDQLMTWECLRDHSYLLGFTSFGIKKFLITSS